MIKLIASDIDGTLLKKGETSLNPHLFEQIRILKEKGIVFVAASGRQYANIRRLFDPVADDIYFIAENGSLCRRHEKTLLKGVIERNLALEIIREVQKKENVECMVSCEDAVYIESEDPAFCHELFDILQNEVVQVHNLAEDVLGDILKIALFVKDDPQETLNHFQQLFSSRIAVVTSGYEWVDFIAPSANKGTTLAALAESLNIDAQDCVAFGDQYNDVEMLQFVGTGYVMSNAAPGMAYYSAFVTDSVVDEIDDIISGLEI
ncbi:Cof subfamily protein (haloacid dehalogenase superfamily) [Aequitasia blattaphilus]|uniref:Cof-type HAD-IIB family hydrolase n=1 Tax=Aequitasia blattaphilus TaxID=2949332 RepID=A0ABT1EDA9_9FIRM|nr:HAD family hydrolase [Aequitasia blattaphilus]MCP1103644.1 Cof-type HAD-IIB family hydrolase [Aequitasia blattaphilus]MCR8616284.1 Cof-type HAD-IIB family hydrolase [Aequitasia blattaphilus]